VIIARVPNKQFANHRAKYFLASRTGRGPNPESLSVDLRLDDALRRELEDVINKQMHTTVPTAFAFDPNIHDPSQQPQETEYDRRVRLEQGKLIYHLEAFKLTPDEDPRLYVRAYWTADSKAQTGLTLWTRFEGHHFQVEQTYAEILQFARDLEKKESGTRCRFSSGLCRNASECHCCRRRLGIHHHRPTRVRKRRRVGPQILARRAS
jgi:hypothetical protein